MSRIRLRYEKLREMRMTRSLTLAQAAERIGVNELAVGRWERGQSVPHINNLRRLCQAYGCEMQDVIEFVREEKPCQQEDG